MKTIHLLIENGTGLIYNTSYENLAEAEKVQKELENEEQMSFWYILTINLK